MGQAPRLRDARANELMFVILALVGCSGGEVGGCAAAEEPMLTIGAGNARYEPHTDGDVGPLEFGPQGGVHLTLAVETTGFQLSDGIIGEISGTIGGQDSASASPFVFLRCDRETETQKAWDLRLAFDPDPGTLNGEIAEVTFELVDEDGRRASDTTTFTLEL